MTTTPSAATVAELRLLPVAERTQALRRERARRAKAKVQERLVEKALRYTTDGAFAAFVKLLWSAVEPRELEWAPYLDVLCHALHRQMLGDEAYQRLLMCVPPGYAKSLLVSVFAPAYEWLFNPARRKLFFAGDDDLTKRDSRRTRQVLQSAAYQGLLVELCRREGRSPWMLAFDQNEKTNFENTDRGFRQCLTLRANSTGKRGDDFVIDDPIGVLAVILGGTEAIVRRCHEVNLIIDQALQTRVNDRRDARQTLIMQRVHLDDPAGSVIRENAEATKRGESAPWKVMVFPLHYDPNHEQVSADDPRTMPGELLHPTRDTEETVDKLIRKMSRYGSAQVEAQLEQRPVPSSGGKIKREWFRERYTCTPTDLAQQADEVWVSVDAAKKKTASSDFHSMHVWARIGNKRHPLARIAERMGYPEFEAALDGLINEWRPWLAKKGGALIEDTMNGTTYLQVRGPSYQGVPLVPFSPTADTPGANKGKDARATYLERAAESGAIVGPSPEVGPWFEDVLTWWCAFPLGAHDDDVDAASQINMRWTLAESGGGQSVSAFALFG